MDGNVLSVWQVRACSGNKVNIFGYFLMRDMARSFIKDEKKALGTDGLEERKVTVIQWPDGRITPIDPDAESTFYQLEDKYPVEDKEEYVPGTAIKVWVCFGRDGAVLKVLKTNEMAMAYMDSNKGIVFGSRPVMAIVTNDHSRLGLTIVAIGTGVGEFKDHELTEYYHTKPMKPDNEKTKEALDKLTDEEFKLIKKGILAGTLHKDML